MLVLYFNFEGEQNEEEDDTGIVYFKAFSP